MPHKRVHTGGIRVTVTALDVDTRSHAQQFRDMVQNTKALSRTVPALLLANPAKGRKRLRTVCNAAEVLALMGPVVGYRQTGLVFDHVSDVCASVLGTISDGETIDQSLLEKQIEAVDAALRSDKTARKDGAKGQPSPAMDPFPPRDGGV